MAFLPFREISALNIAVEVGFVDGTRAQTTPIGTAIFNTLPFASSPTIPTVFKFFIDS